MLLSLINCFPQVSEFEEEGGEGGGLDEISEEGEAEDDEVVEEGVTIDGKADEEESD